MGLALDVQSKLDEKNIPVRVVSMPSMELFLKQDASYQEKVIPSSCNKIASIEAGITLGWKTITGKNGLNFGVDDYGTSAPAGKIYEKFGLTVGSITEKVLHWIQ